MKTIMIKNNKGGVGKTTVSVNLTSLLAQRGYKVLIIDSDTRANTTRMYANKQTLPGTLGELLLDRKAIQECILKTRYENIDLIPSTNELERDIKDLEQNSLLVDYENLKNKVDLVNDKYDYCIIDCSQRIDLLALNILFASDLVLIPTKAEENSLVGVIEMDQVVKQVNAKRRNPLISKILVADKERNKACDAMIERMKFVLGVDSVLQTVVRHQAAVVNESVSEAVLTPFVALDKHKNSGIVEDMKLLMNEVIELLEVE